MRTAPKQRLLADPGATISLRETRDGLDRLDRLDLESLPAVRGRYLTVGGSRDILLKNGQVNKLVHGLGRALDGWRIMGLKGASATGRIVEVTSSAGTADPQNDLWLDVQGHGADITVRLWVE